MVREVGHMCIGVLQGSPMSAVLFHIWMSTILGKMEKRVKKECGVGLEFQW